MTFEVLAASFGLDGDAALMPIGSLVHCLDIGARRLAAVRVGAGACLASDNALLAETGRVFHQL